MSSANSDRPLFARTFIALSTKMDVHSSASSPQPGHFTRDKVVLHAAYPLWRKHTLVTLARAKELQDAGNQVAVTYCNATAGTCAVNYGGNPIACMICKNRVKKTAKALGLDTIPLSVNGSVDDRLPEIPYSEKRALMEGVQSGVISTFRTLPKESRSNSMIAAIKRRYFRNASQLLKSMKAVVRELQPDRIEVFNGRHACSKFSIIAATSAGIPFTTFEVTARQFPMICPGYTVHDRHRVQERILSHPADFEVAERYYLRNRQPRDNKYAKKHRTPFVPPDTSGYRKRISVFLSSQDEFESLGKEWVSPFLNYGPIVEKACRENPDIMFLIRFHPNQADMAGDVLTPFNAVSTLPNARIFSPTDTVNSYALMEWSDTVVTFGSTITVEACWAGKAAIMLGPSFFDELDIAYTPKTLEEFGEVLRMDLKPKCPENAARFAHFQEYDFDPLQYVRHTGRTMVENGFYIRHPWLGQIARTTEDLICNGIKLWASRSARSRKSA